MMKTVKCETNGKSACHKFLVAAEEGNLETIQQMLQVGNGNRVVIPIDCMCPYEDWMALYAVSSRGHVNIVKFLLQAGANIHFWVAVDGSTALHAVCEYAASIAVVEELIQEGAKMDMPNKSSLTPLMRLMFHPKKHRTQLVEICCLLLSAKCDVNTADNYDCMALYYACTNDDNEEMLHMLIEAGADLISQEKGCLLHCCIERPVMNNLCILLHHYRIDLYLRNQCGQTALHVAVVYKQLNAMQILLPCDDDCDFNYDGTTTR